MTNNGMMDHQLFLKYREIWQKKIWKASTRCGEQLQNVFNHSRKYQECS